MLYTEYRGTRVSSNTRRLVVAKILLPYGNVLVAPMSKTRIVLVFESTQPNPLWKIPGGSVEEDEPSLFTARRELWEETGIRCPMLRFKHVSGSALEKDQFYIARLSEELLETWVEQTSGNGENLYVREFDRATVMHRSDILPQHIPFLRQVI